MADNAGVSMEIRPEGLDEVKRRLRGLTATLHKPSRLMKAIGAALASSTKRRFRAGVSPDGTPWKPSQRAKLKGGKTLIKSARLLQSIASDGDDTRAIVGTNLVYARIHQLGGPIKIRHAGAGLRGRQGPIRTQWMMPARPYLGVSEDDRVEIADQVRRSIERAVA